MNEMAEVNGQQLDVDTIDILQLLSEQGELSTTEARSRLHLKDNDYTRRRLQWLADAGLAKLDKRPWTANSSIDVTVGTITSAGHDFIDSWNFDGHGKGLPLEERMRRLESRMDQVEERNVDRLEDMEASIRIVHEELDRLQKRREALKRGHQAIVNYLRNEVNVDLRKYHPDE